MIKVHILQDRKDCVKNIGTYFDAVKKSEWFDLPLVREIIKGIDKTDVIKGPVLESPVLGIMSPDKLSSGCKAVILLAMVPDINIYATRCGNNCAPYIEEVARDKDVVITLHHCLLFTEDVELVFLDSGLHVHSRKEYINEFYRLNDERLGVSWEV